MGKVNRNPRIIVSFSPAQYDLLKRLGELSDRPMSKVILDLVEQVEPMLREVTVALEAAAQAKGKPAAQLISAMTRLQTAMEQATEHAVNQADMFSGQLARTTKRLKKRSVTASGKRKRARGR